MDQTESGILVNEKSLSINEGAMNSNWQLSLS